MPASEPANNPDTPAKPHWFFKPYFQISLSIAFSAASQVFLKIGADQSVAADAALGFSGLHSGWVWLGIVSMITSLFSWLYCLRFIPLNIAACLTGSIHVMVALSSWFFLGEKISAGRWLGIFLVVAGVLVIARPLMKIEEEIEGRL